MLSLSMVKVLRSLSYCEIVGSNKDGRVLHALRTRGLVTKVNWSNSMSTYTFRLTRQGQKVRQNLRYLDSTVLKDLFK